TVATHQKDGIARGTGLVVTLANQKDNLVVLNERAAAYYSFSKGTSTQSYPGSMMGSIALLRQTYIDGKWYQSNPSAEGVNITLKYWNETQDLPQVFEANDKWNCLRADRIGDEFGKQYIIKAGGNEYQRIKEMADTKATFIVPLNFPAAMDVEDPNDARFVSITTLKHWELAPGNPAAFEQAGIPFCLTAADLRDSKSFISNLRKAIQYGLSERKALEALTITPAKIMNVANQVGTLDAGKLANFLVTNGPVFDEKTSISENWVQGNRYTIKDDHAEINAKYKLSINTLGEYAMEIRNANSASLVRNADTLQGKLTYDGTLVKLFASSKKSKQSLRLSGVVTDSTWSGIADDSAGNHYSFVADYVDTVKMKVDSAKPKEKVQAGRVLYPFSGYGFEEMPKQETILIKNATVWTNEQEGRLPNTDVLVRSGKIAAIGKNLSATGAKVIDATGKYLSPGIIDEHSHIAASSINEGGQSVTSEVRIQDNLNPDDGDIYFQLAGGVTSSHILHGSANTIGGQTQLIKLRWGANDRDIIFEGADPFIKFALGENVKRSAASSNVRFPDTRMGVEEVLADAFQRASDYNTALKNSAGKKTGPTGTTVRRDLELEALSEILNGKRFITCHSYVQSEITAAMRVAEKYGFKFNTFTHILEGYKVADKMKAHGAAASTFSDWWAYKNEVMDAIPYNPSIMHEVGLNVAINSDDAEMARRLNQEAAKSVKYGGMSEEDAFNMVTLNPAKMLHIDKQVGSIRIGKDADLVVWSDNPLSIYAKPEQTIVDGIIYFDKTRDEEMRKRIQTERSRIIKKMIDEKKSGSSTVPASATVKTIMTCSDHMHSHGLLVQEDQSQN
ncbi:MAG TPA: amidohydrolase family protein, partial [Flavitalea sp.]|nr:amidohydrolase family protein [Flavitalea sp.]